MHRAGRFFCLFLMHKSGFFKFLHHKLELCAHSLALSCMALKNSCSVFVLLFTKESHSIFHTTIFSMLTQVVQYLWLFFQKNNLFHINPSYLIFGSLFKSFILLFTKELLHCSLEMICWVLITTTKVMKSLVCFIDKRKLFLKELFWYCWIVQFCCQSLIPKYGRQLLLLLLFQRMTH
jgi:hypothetical protein